MTAFTGTIEFLHGQRAAIITLDAPNGGWSVTRLEAPRLSHNWRSDLYESGYDHASTRAAEHGGQLNSYRVLS
jgi:hypothetical protein